jgi:hypothetical protein
MLRNEISATATGIAPGPTKRMTGMSLVRRVLRYSLNAGRLNSLPDVDADWRIIHEGANLSSGALGNITIDVYYDPDS